MSRVVVGIVASGYPALMSFEEVRAKFGGTVKNTQNSVEERLCVQHLS